MRVLFVDDRAENVVTYMDIFRRRGDSIDYASDMASAVKMLEESEYDVVIVDVHLPGIVPAQLRKYDHKLSPNGLNEGQLLGLWLEEFNPSQRFFYLTAVPGAFESGVGRVGELYDKNSTSAKRLYEIVVAQGLGASL